MLPAEAFVLEQMLFRRGDNRSGLIGPTQKTTRLVSNMWDRRFKELDQCIPSVLALVGIYNHWINSALSTQRTRTRTHVCVLWSFARAVCGAPHELFFSFFHVLRVQNASRMSYRHTPISIHIHTQKLNKWGGRGLTTCWYIAKGMNEFMCFVYKFL